MVRGRADGDQTLLGENRRESSILCDCGDTMMDRCLLRANMWGIAVQGGQATMQRCRAHANDADGILIQANGVVVVLQSEVFDNGSHAGSSSATTLLGGFAWKAAQPTETKGGSCINNGTPQSGKVELADNHERHNKGMQAIQKKL